MKQVVYILFFIFGFGLLSNAQKSPLDNTPSQSKSLVHFYPNPAVNYIIFEFKEPISPGTALHVYSFLGRQVAQLPVNAQRITVNITNYFKGVYIFQLRNSMGKILETNKFQVNR